MSSPERSWLRRVARGMACVQGLERSRLRAEVPRSATLNKKSDRIPLTPLLLSTRQTRFPDLCIKALRQVPDEITVGHLGGLFDFFPGRLFSAIGDVRVHRTRASVVV